MDEQSTAVQGSTESAIEQAEQTTTTAEQTEQTTEQVESTEQTTAEQPNETTDNVDLFADYKPNLPNGVNEEVFAEALPVFKELGLSPEQADKIMPIADKLVQQTVGKVLTDISDQCHAGYDSVMADLKADRSFGGKNFEQTVSQINNLLTKYGDEKTPAQFHEAMTALSGWENGTESVKSLFISLSKMAKDAADDTLILGGTKKQEPTYYPGVPKGAKFK